VLVKKAAEANMLCDTRLGITQAKKASAHPPIKEPINKGSLPLMAVP
jgi:hypothetical protein